MFAPDFLLKDIYAVNDEFIEKNNIKAVIFDIDNTLVGFKEPVPPERVVNFIASLREKGIRVSVASNNSKARVSLFCRDLNIDYISRACKPLPFALLSLCKKMCVSPRNTLMVGDQVYTDSLGANVCGMVSAMVDIIDTKETLTFKIKRALEKPIIERKKRKDAEKNG